MNQLPTKHRRVYEFGPFTLHPEERLLLRGDVFVPLTPKAFDLLVALVESNGSLLEKSVLMDRIWPEGFVEEANLSVNISALRKALGEGPNDAHYIQTVPRHGYRFVAQVDERCGGEEDSEPARTNWGIPTQADVRIRQSPAAKPRPQRAAMTVSVILILAAVLLGFNAGGLRARLSGPKRVIRSLAVLPLQNASEDPSQDYISQGFTEALITNLAGIDELRVMSLQSVLKYRGTKTNAAQVGRELGVDAVLTGSVLRSRGHARLSLQLIDTESNGKLWSGTYERNVRDVLAMQSEVSRDIAGDIGVRLPPRIHERFTNAPPVNPVAYDHYLRGQYHLYRQNKQDNESAIKSLQRAASADPDFAAAHAELAQAYVWKLYLFDPKDKSLPEKAFIASEKALALDPDSAVAHLARGRLLWTPANHFPHEKAMSEYRRALELNPNLDEARNQLALVYCHIGAFDEALLESHKAVAANPNNNMAQFRSAQTLNFQGKYDEALTALRAIPQDANPALLGYQIAWALFNLDRKLEASTLLAQLLKDHPEDTGGVYTSVQAVIEASNGNHRVAEQKIQAAIEIGKGFGHFHHTAYTIACAYAHMNQRGKAVKWLQAAADDGFPCYPLFASDSNLNSLRQDPQFIALLSRLRSTWERYKAIL